MSSNIYIYIMYLCKCSCLYILYIYRPVCMPMFMYRLMGFKNALSKCLVTYIMKSFVREEKTCFQCESLTSM